MATIEGTDLSDLILGTNGADYIVGGLGDDTINGRLGFDTLDGGVGNDVAVVSHAGSSDGFSLTYTLGGGLVLTRAGGATALDRFERVSITTGSGDDFFDADTSGRDTLSSGVGNDTVTSEAGADLLHGGDGSDRLILDRNTATANLVFVMSEDATLVRDGTRATGFEAVFLTTGSGADSLVGGAMNDTLHGGAGNDTIDAGSGGRDGLDGGEGNDLGIVSRAGLTESVTLSASFSGLVLSGVETLISLNRFERVSITTGSGDDVFDADTAGRDTLSSGAGNDTVTSEAGADLLHGGDGFDRLILDRSAATANLVFVLSADATLVRDGTRATGFEEVRLTTGSGRDSLVGGAMNDTLQGGAGNDTIDAGSGGRDGLDGGEGNDLAIVSRADLTESVTLSASFNGLVLSGVETLVSLDRFERVSIATGSGNDTLLGTAAADTLSGGGGADSLSGGLGNDLLVGGAGNDTLIGGAGEDIYAVGAPGAGIDLLVGFRPDFDILRVSAADFGGLLPPGSLDPSRFAAGTAVGTHAQFVLTVPGANAVLVWDSNGADAGGASAVARFSGVPALTAGDFTVIA